MLGTVDQSCLFPILDALAQRIERMLTIADEMQGVVSIEVALQDLATLRIALRWGRPPGYARGRRSRP